MKPINWTTEKRKVSELIPHEKNPRKLSKEQEVVLTESITKFNLAEIPVVNTDNKILAGHQRLKIMFLLGRGEEEIEVRVPTRTLSESEADEYLVRSNKNGGEFDFDILSKEFELEDLTEWGFDKHELPAFDGGSVGDFFEDGEEEKKTPPQIKVTHTCPHCKKEFEA